MVGGGNGFEPSISDAEFTAPNVGGIVGGGNGFEPSVSDAESTAPSAGGIVGGGNGFEPSSALRVKAWGVVPSIAITGPKSNATAHIHPAIFRVINGSFAWR
jgi:hypothetical protein